jgi:hypothetical protein
MIDVELSKVRGLLRDKEFNLKKTEDVLLSRSDDGDDYQSSHLVVWLGLLGPLT